MADYTLPHNFTPREYQVPLFAAMDGGADRAVCVWHRRAGKDKAALNHTIKRTQQRIGIYYYFFPTYAQGRKVIWDGMDRSGMPYLHHFPKKLVTSRNNTEMKVKLQNGSIFQIVGTDNYNSIVGTNPVGCVFSEYALQDPICWELVKPILRENQGWAIFISTPRGHNHLFGLYNMAMNNPRWFCQLLTVDDTGVVTPAEIDIDREEGMSEDMIRQEYYCSFEAAISGEYFALQMRQAQQEGRICGVEYDRDIPITTYWDLGIGDSTAVWFCQFCGNEIHLIHYYENSQEPIHHYIDYLSEIALKNGWTGGYRDHYWPHDSQQREKSSGKSLVDLAREQGLRPYVVPRPNRKIDSIEYARHIFQRCWFDQKGCKRGIEALQDYRKEWDNINKVFKDHPLHNWTSHGADAFQLMAIQKRPDVRRVSIQTAPTMEERLKAKLRGRPLPLYHPDDGAMLYDFDFDRGYGEQGLQGLQHY